MNQRHTPRRLAALALCVLLSAAAPPVAAQRRSRSVTPAPRRPSSAPAPRTEPRAPQPQQRDEPDRSFEELLPAEGYGAYVEMRGLSQILNLPEAKSAGAAFSLLDPEMAVFAEVVDFYEKHKEVLADSRFAFAMLPSRPGLPQLIAALQLDSPEAAARFEPVYRAYAEESARSLAGPAPAPKPARTRRRRTPARTRPPAPPVIIKRLGSLLITADKQFTPGRLRPAGAASLAENARFQTLRSRFASEQLFVYLDVERAREGWMQFTVEEQQERERAARAAGETELPVEVITGGPLSVVAPVEGVEGEGQKVEAETAVEVRDDDAPVTPEEREKAEREMAEMLKRVEAEEAVARASEERQAAAGMQRLLRGLWGGVPHIPGTAALAVGLEGNTLTLRVAVERAGGGPVNLVPFLPNVISGAPVTSEAAQVAPAGAGIFLSTSLDWARIFDALIGTAKESTKTAEARPEEQPGATPAGAEGDARTPSPDETLAQIEKFFGFKVREDFLPTLGSEVAISLPLDELTRGMRLNAHAVEAAKTSEEAQPAEPGFVAYVALNDPEKAARLLPRVLMMLGLAPVGMSGAAASETERREGFEIRAIGGGMAYAVVGNFLVLGQLPQVRHAVGEAAAHRTLAATNAYRDATAWQAKQKLLQAYLSDGLMRHTIEQAKRQAGGSSDPFVLAALPQLDVQPEAAALATTDEGDLVLHELRLPLNLIRVFGVSAMIGIKEAPVIGNEMSAAFALSNIRSAQDVFRSQEGRERYGTLEELIAEDLLEKGYVEQLEYAVELTALGDKFEVTATPKQYGKTGRRSFFLDQSGIIRAADHKGKPASAQDPPID